MLTSWLINYEILGYLWIPTVYLQICANDPYRVSIILNITIQLKAERRRMIRYALKFYNYETSRIKLMNGRSNTGSLFPDLVLRNRIISKNHKKQFYYMQTQLSIINYNAINWAYPGLGLRWAEEVLHKRAPRRTDVPPDENRYAAKEPDYI